MQEVLLPVEGENSQAVQRTLGAIGMVLAPGLLVGSQFYSMDIGAPNQIYASVFGVLYLTGAAASITAIRRMRVTGSGRGAAILYCIQIIVLLLAMSVDVMEYAAPQVRKSTAFFITDLSYPLSHVMMLVMAFAVLRARVWSGWRVLPAFIIGLALPSFFASNILTGSESSGLLFIGGVTLGFALLGLAVLTWNSRGTQGAADH